MRAKVSLLITSILFLFIFNSQAQNTYPSTWQVNGNGYTGTLVLQAVDPVTNKVSGTLLGTPVEGYLVGRHLVLHRYPERSTQIWEAWIMDPALGAHGQVDYDGSFFMAGYVSENNGALDGVYPWYGLSFTSSTPPPIPTTPTTLPTQSGTINNPNNGHSYKLFDSKMTWKDARTFCKNQGGYLASLTSKAENDFVYNNLISPSGHLAWLGGTDEISEGNWQWITGEAWNYNNWKSAEPNNLGGNENYLHSNISSTNQWNDLANEGGYGYVDLYPLCEWGGNIVQPPPLPTAGVTNYPNNGHNYKLFASAMTWKDAKSYCESQGAYLATLTSQAENDFVYDNVIGPIDAYIWLGGTDENSEGNWQWITGEPWSYSNWEISEPNNAGGTEHYLETNYYYLNQWNDSNNIANYNNIDFYPLCEWGSGNIQSPPPIQSGEILNAANISSWTDLGGNAIDLAVQGTTVWMVAQDNSIYYYDDGWHKQPGNWSAKAIDVSRDGVLWLIGTDNKIYHNRDGVWTEQPGGGRATDIALDSKGNPSLIGSGRSIHYFENDGWPQYPFNGRAYQIAVSSDGIPFVVGTDNHAYRLTDTAWVLMDIENLVDIAIGGNDQIWAVDKDGNIYYYDIGQWHLLNQGKGKRISVTANNQVYIVGLDDHIWIATYR